MLEVLPLRRSPSWRRRTASRRTRPGATAGSCTPACTTSPGRSRRRCAAGASGSSASFCAERGLRYDEIGKVLVAARPRTSCARAGGSVARPRKGCPTSASSTARELGETGPTPPASPPASPRRRSSTTPRSLASSRPTPSRAAPRPARVRGDRYRSSAVGGGGACRGASGERGRLDLVVVCAGLHVDRLARWPATRRRRASCRSAASTTR